MQQIFPENQKKMFSCSFCDLSFDSYKTKNRHVAGSHKGRVRNECDFCHKVFRKPSQLEGHMRIHTQERPFGCKTCKKSYTLQGYLDRHLLSHLGEAGKIYRCTICSKGFVESSKLKRHMSVHTGQKTGPYTCIFCAKMYTQKHNLDKHLMCHIGERPYNCTRCGETYVSKTDLDRHFNVHLGVDGKRHECPFCPRKFAEGHNLNNHIKCHLNERPHKCSTCGRGFRFACRLKKHQLVHST